MLARRSLSPVRSFAATVVEPRPTGKVFAFARRIVLKKDDETAFILHEKQGWTFHPLT